MTPRLSRLHRPRKPRRRRWCARPSARSRAARSPRSSRRWRAASRGWRRGAAVPRPRARGASGRRSSRSIAALGVYRTYADAAGIGAEDRARVRGGGGGARGARRRGSIPTLFDFVAAVLTLDRADGPSGAAVLEAALRVQQLSGPVMAKGLEDTALYRYNRLIALNEVGSEPGRFGDDARRLPRRERRTAGEEPRAHARHLDARHQARRGRPRAHRGAAAPCGAWASDGRRMARPARRSGAADRPQRRVLLLPAAARRLAGGVAAGSRAAGGGAGARSATRVRGGDAEVGARGRGQHPLGFRRPGLRGARSPPSSRERSPVPANAFLALVPRLRGGGGARTARRTG